MGAEGIELRLVMAFWQGFYRFGVLKCQQKYQPRVQIRSATLINGLGGRDAIASEPLDRQVKVAWNELHTFIRGERYQIAILLKVGHKQSDVARLMNRHPAAFPPRHGPSLRPNWPSYGVPNRFPAISSLAGSSALATKPSISASTPTGALVAHCTAPRVARRPAESVMVAATDAALSPTRCRSSNATPLSMAANASATGKPIW